MALDNKAIQDIIEDDLKDLIENQVPEDKTIDYKEILSVEKPSDKKEFVKDISTFANTLGGNIVYGMKEEKGIPVQLCGMPVDNPDELKQRLDNLIRDCTAPRIYGIQIKCVPLQNSNFAIVIKTPKSFNPPHMVTIDGERRFYGRNSSGRYPLNVEELRHLFLLSDTTGQRIRDFRAERISLISTGDAPVPLISGLKIVLHLVPFDSLTLHKSHDLFKVVTSRPSLPQIKWAVRFSEGKYNFDGYVSYKPSACSYTQLFRNGIIEAVCVPDYNPSQSSNRQQFLEVDYEDKVIGFVTEILPVFSRMEVSPPIFCLLTLLESKGYILTDDPEYGNIDGEPFDRDRLVLPEVMIPEFESDLTQKMRLSFDIVRNAAGLEPQ